MKSLIAGALAAGALLLGASAANAATGFTMEMTKNGNTFDTALVTLMNTSSTASLTSLTLNFATSPYNIDRAVSFTRLGAGGVQLNWSILSPDSSDGSVRSDLLSMTFTGFEARNPDEGLSFALDFDPDNSNSSDMDFRNILFNNGALNNAVLTVGFSDGTSLTQTLADGAPQTSYLFTGSTAGAVPEPMSWALMITGFAGVGGMMRSRRRQGMAAAA